MATETRSNKVKNILNILVRIIISFGLLSLLFYKCDIHKFIATLKDANLYFLIIALFMYFLLQLLGSYRWSRILIADDINIPFMKVVSFYFLGMFFNLFLPTLIGGDVVKGYSFYKDTKKAKEAITSILVDRLSGFFALMTLAGISLIIGYRFIIEEREIFYLLVIIVISFFLLLYLVTNKNFFYYQQIILLKLRFNKLKELVEKLYRVVEKYKSHRQMVVSILLLSFIIQIGSIFLSYIVALTLGLSIPLIYFFLFLPLIIIVSMLPISIGGLGVREGMCVYLFSKLGIEGSVALSFSLLSYLITLIISLFGIVSLFKK